MMANITLIFSELLYMPIINHIKPIHPEVIAHHMTIKLGPLDGADRNFIGQKVKLKVVSYASDDKVDAVGVEQIGNQPESHNKIPHITLSVNRSSGGKPFHSNKLTKWEPLDNTIELDGIISEVTA
jgi:hypothetical protein